MKFHRKADAWYTNVLLNPVVLFMLGCGSNILLPALSSWGWGFWWEVDCVRINSLIGAWLAYLISSLLLVRFLNFPGTSPVVYVIPTVSSIYALLLLVLLVLRLEYSRPLLISAYTMTLLFCWITFNFRLNFRPMTYAIVPSGEYESLLEIDGVEWQVLSEPYQLSGRVDAVVADFYDKKLLGKGEHFLAQCALNNIPVYHIKQITEALTGRAKIERLQENNLGSLMPSPIYILAKRAFDILSALVAIPLLSPLLL
ncbi:MAG: sugar transferase, partial [Aeromonas sp.]